MDVEIATNREAAEAAEAVRRHHARMSPAPDAAPGTEADPAPERGGCTGTCACGHADEPGFPVLDARAVPHAIRHATVMAALDTVPAAGGLVLVAPHDPLPLLDQVAERFGGSFETSYLERGPEAWRLVLLRRAGV